MKDEPPAVPWTVQGLTFAFAAMLAAVQGFTFLYIPHELWSRSPLRLSILGGYAIAAGLFVSFPWNPYMEKPSELSVGERRILVACYEPKSRWRAARTALLFASFPLLLSVIAALFPLGVFAPDMDIATASALLFVTSVTCGAAAGFYGLTEPLRRRWRELTSTGPAWPASLDYPGSRVVAFRSLLTGNLPSFLDQA